MIRFLARFGFYFEDREEERAFADRFLLSTVAESQFFLIASGIFVYAFFVWDRIIDPAHWQITHLIRGLVIVPFMLTSAALLFTRFGKRHFEAVIMVTLLGTQVGLATVYGILDHGYEYAALGFALTLCGTTAMFPIRSRYLLLTSLLTLPMVITAHLWAHNARPGWLTVNIMAVACAIVLGSLSAYMRERSARAGFRTMMELAASRARVEDLLHSMLPREIAARIQAGETAIAEAHNEVSIIFADLMGFTDLARKVSAAQLLQVLNSLFSAFDLEAERLGIDRIKTIGDAYMAVGGLSREPDGRDHAECAAELAFGMLDAVRDVVHELGYPIQVRIGLHIGPVVAGVIGVRRPAFDCWGDAVNFASRLESRAEPDTILISESAYWRLRPLYEIEPHPDLELKGIGPAKAYRLKGRLSEARPDLAGVDPVTLAWSRI